MRIHLSSGTPAELAVPPDGESLRGVVIAPDVHGLRPLFDEMAARLATDHGWAVLAVEPYPDGADIPLDARLDGAIDVDRIVTDLQLGADELHERAHVERIAVLGFCMGGMNAFRAAGTGAFDRAVAFYGMVRPPQQWSQPGNDPLDALRRPDCCPVLAIFGGADTWTPAEDIEAVKSSGALVSARVYDGAQHGFVHDPSRPSHRPDDAADAWRWAVEFLA